MATLEELVKQTGGKIVWRDLKEGRVQAVEYKVKGKGSKATRYAYPDSKAVPGGKDAYFTPPPDNLGGGDSREDQLARAVREGSARAPAGTSTASTGTSAGTTGGTQAPRTVDYTLKPGESIAAYTSRIEAERKGNFTTPASSGAKYNLSPTEQALYDQLESYVKKLEASGQSVNPNIEITKKQAADFLRQAEQEIDPYYKSQLKVARDALLRELGYSEDQILQEEQQLERQYQDTRQQTLAAAAESGLAQSGQRVKAEDTLALGARETLAAGRRSLNYNANSLASAFARDYGTTNLPNSTIATAPNVFSGQQSFTRSSRALPMYELSSSTYDKLKGAKEFERDAAVKSRAAQLEGVFRGKGALDQTRRLTLS